jgi:hypothetical protein
VLRLLGISGILAAAIRERDGRLRLWIGDAGEGVRETALVAEKDAPAWLEDRALRHYPDSAFAQVRRFLSAALVRAAKSRT